MDLLTGINQIDSLISDYKLEVSKLNEENNRNLKNKEKELRLFNDNTKSIDISNITVKDAIEKSRSEIEFDIENIKLLIKENEDKFKSKIEQLEAIKQIAEIANTRCKCINGWEYYREGSGYDKTYHRRVCRICGGRLTINHGNYEMILRLGIK